MSDADRTKTANKTKRDTILRVAAKMFAKQGYSGTDVQAVADRAGVGKGTIYRYFDDKKGLFLSVSTMVWDDLLDYIMVRADGAETALDRVVAGIRANMEFFQRHPHYVELVMIERATFGGSVRPTQHVHRDQNLHLLAEALDDAVAEGSLRPLNSTAVAQALADFVNGTYINAALTKQTKELGKRGETIVEMFLECYGKR